MDIKQIIETLSYLEKFKENIVVIKFGGELSPKANQNKTTLFEDVALLKKVGMHPVLVHGGGKEITKQMEKKNIKAEFVQGQRITDKKSMKVVIDVLGQVRKDIIDEIKKYYLKCTGYPTKSTNIFAVEKLILKEKVDLGYVGKIKNIFTLILQKKIFSGFIPVISSLGRGEDGKIYNINADVAAAKLAIALRSEKLFFLTDVEGIYSDFHNKSSLISSLSPKEGKKLISSGNISSGMIPKLHSSLDAISGGVKSCYIISGKIPHALLAELFTEKGLGTMIKGNN